jgi:glycerate kinase
MKVLISPNVFKGTIAADRAAVIIANRIKDRFPSYLTKVVPVADGGDGTCFLLSEILNLEIQELWSLNAYGRPVKSSFGWNPSDKTAYIDISNASGLASVQNQPLDPFVASTYGTGIVIQRAIQIGAKRLIVGLGGSATIDLGIGILAALGVSFLDQKGRALTPFSPDYLSNIKHIQLSPTLPKVKFVFLCDVKNTFFGENGAVPVFGPQKGLKTEDSDFFVSTCESVLLRSYAKTRKPFFDMEGFGAAGGIAAGIAAFFPTEIKMGSSYFFEKAKIKEHVKWSDLILTGEGKYDTQSKEGKATFELLRLAKSEGKKIGLITGGIEPINDQFDLIIRLPELDFSKSDFIATAQENLEKSLISSFDANFWT